MDSQNQHVPHDQPHAADHDEIPKDLPKLRNWTVALAAVVVAICFVGLFVLGWRPHQKREAELEQASKAVADLRPVVQTIAPQRSDTGHDLVIPADVRAMQETRIFPRASGYLKRTGF